MSAEEIAAKLTKADRGKLKAWIQAELGDQADGATVIVCNHLTKGQTDD
jgi:hypothetical protein